MKKRPDAFTEAARAKPPCHGCSVCGDCRENALYALAPDEKYYCHVHFYERAHHWPRPKPRVVVGPKPTTSVEVVEDDWVEEVSPDLERAGGDA